MGRPVVDRTGLAGNWDLELTFTAESQRQQGGDAGPSIFTAIQEQLGLTLEATTAAVDVLLVDRADRPLPD